MAKTFDLIVRGGTLVTADSTGAADIGIRDGRFVEVGDLTQADSGDVIDATGLHVLPGVIDSQVHFREPGLEHKEDLASGTKAALLGGVTAIFEMPNTNPATDTPEALDDKFTRAKGRAWTDHAFFVGATERNAGHLADLECLPGCVGIKIFMGSSTGSLLVSDDETLEQALRSGRRRVAVHAEDEPRLIERKALAEGGDPAKHPIWRDVETARLATERILRLARLTGRPVHVLHITTADEMAILANAKDAVTVECTPQHLTLEAPGCYERLGTFAQMNPPIRGGEHRAALWSAVADGTVDVIGSDHAPHTREEKARPYPQSPSGMPGVQTLLPLMLNHVHEGRLSLNHLVALTSANPARLYGATDKGSVAPGNWADLTLVDLSRRQTIEPGWLASKCGWSPFEGDTVQGWPVATIIRGRMAMQDGTVCGDPGGQPVLFNID